MISMKNFLFPVLFLFCISQIFSQTQNLEDITIDMLKSTKSTIFPEADAEVIYEKGSVSFKISNAWEYEYEVVRRIKIYTQEGYDQANVQIPFYVGDKNADKESVSNINGYVFFEKDGKIEREKLRNRDIFSVDIGEMWEAKKFTLPKIQDGVIIEYSYTIKSPHLTNLPTWVFQNRIPTLYSEFQTRIPVEYLIYGIKTKGYYTFDTFTEEKQNILYANSKQVKTLIKNTQHVAENLPKISTESYVNNVSNYLPSIGYELTMFKSGQFDSYETVSRTWDDVMNSLAETKTFKDDINKSSFYEEDLETVLKDKDLPQEKMHAIFDFIKDRMTWNGEERRYLSDKIENVYESGVGNSADINVLLTSMLRYAKLEANPVLSSTTSNGIPLYPTISGLNYVFTHVDINGEIFLLDATDEFSAPNILPSRVLNWTGKLLKTDGFKPVKLTPSESSLKKYQVQAKISAEGIIEGKCRIVSSNHFGLESRKDLSKKSPEDVKLTYKNRYGVGDVQKVSVSNIKNNSKPLLEGFSFSTSGDYIEKIGDKLYLSPMLFLNSKENPFREDDRLYPIDFTFPKDLSYYISLELPEGYTVDSVPEKAIFKLGEEDMILTYLIDVFNNKITVKVDQNINTILFLPKDYQNLKEFYSNLINKENEKIVLVKS